MPRGVRKMTQSGAPGQKVESVPGQRYGEGVEQQAMQQAMPAPDVAGMPAPSAPSSVGPPPAGDPQRPTADPAAIQQFLQAHKPGLLSSGTQRPDESIMTGLGMGPGAGPESLAMSAGNTPLARTLQRLSMDTGNPMFSRLAERAGL